MQKKETLGELIRFGIVGTTSAAIHYAIYWILQHWIEVNVAYTIGYVLSFLVNYYLTAHFTFKEKTAAYRALQLLPLDRPQPRTGAPCRARYRRTHQLRPREIRLQTL